MSTSQRTPARQAEASQSARPRSTSSTKRYLSGGSARRKASFSSGELTVIVQTVFCSPLACGAQTTANNAASMNGEADMRMGENYRRSPRSRTSIELFPQVQVHRALPLYYVGH